MLESFFILCVRIRDELSCLSCTADWQLGWWFCKEGSYDPAAHVVEYEGAQQTIDYLSSVFNEAVCFDRINADDDDL